MLTGPAFPRRPRGRSITALLISLVSALPVATVIAGAQSPRHIVVRHVERFTTEDGLAENHVRTILQDRTGFIWVVTRGGVLQRYDGHAFVEYRVLSPDAPIELSRDTRSLMRDAEGAVWVATSDAVFRVDQARWMKIPVASDDRSTLGTGAGRKRLWFLDGGSLKWIDTERVPPVVVPSGDTGDVLGVGRGGVVWIAHSSGSTAVVTRLDPATGARQSFPAGDVALLLGVTEDAAGRVWLSGTRGLSVLEPAGGAFRPVDAFIGKATTPLAPDENGGFLAATNDWMARIDSAGHVTERLTAPDVFGRSAIPNAVLTDREGGIWLATTTAGLFRLHTSRSAFDNYSSRSTPIVPLGSDFVMALLERADGTLWLGTLGGDAYRITPDWSKAERFRGERNTRDVWDFEEDADGNLWMGTSLEICRLEAASFRCHDAQGSVLDIERDASGWFWLATGPRGVISFDPRQRVFGERVQQVTELSRAQDVLTLFADRDSNYLWIGAGNAILRARADRGRIVSEIQRFRAPLGSQDLIYDFHRDGRGNFFVGTGAGLLRWKEDSSGGEFVPIELRELRESTIFSISEDSSGRLWLGSSHGLVQYSPDRGHARRYGRRDNFLSGELNRRAALKRRSGEMLFGGIEGVTQFDPDVVAGSHGNPSVVITRWITMTGNGPVEIPIAAEQRVRLEPGDRAFTVEFAELSYSPNPGRRYRYRLEGLNENWIEATDHVANFAAPPPGEYVFRVQAAAGGDGEWSNPGASLAVDVIPPFWKTAWFQIALVLAAGMLIWLAHQWRLRQALVAERLRLRISRDLHDEIGAGLSSIALLSDAGARGNAGLELKRIGESARNMVADLREIVWAIDPDSDRASDVVSRMRDVAANLLRDVRVTFDVQAADTSGGIGMEVRRHLLLIYKEILHNIAKHAEATEVNIQLQVRRGSIELTVADNGVGFSPNGSRAGTGLKSLSERAVHLGGDLQLDSAPGRGTTVRFRLRRT